MKQGSFGQPNPAETLNEELLVNKDDCSWTNDNETPGNDPKASQQDDETRYSTSSLAKGIAKGAIPCMIQFFSALFVNNTTLHYISLKSTDLDLYNGISLALNIMNCFSFYVIFHSNIGFNAAASQAMGAKNNRLVGLYLHRAFIIHLIVNTFAYGILLGAPFLFSKMGVNPEFSKVAFSYLLLSPGYIFGVIIFDTLKNFLYVHKIFDPLVYIQIGIAISYWFLADYLFIKKDLGVNGMIFAISASQGVGVLLLLAYFFLFKPKQIRETWFWFEKESFKGLWHLAKVMASVGGMGYVEVFAYRIQSFASMYFASAQTAALTAFLAFGDLFYVLPLGVSFPVITYIGSAMGSRNKGAVLRIIKVTLVMSAVLLAILITVFGIWRTNFFKFYNQDPDVLKVMEEMGLMYFFTFPADFAQTLFAGIIKGTGQEKRGTKFFLLALYLVGVPLALWCAFFFKMQSPGIWLGNGIGLYVATISFGWIIYKTNYQKQFEYIRKRNNKGQGKRSQTEGEENENEEPLTIS